MLVLGEAHSATTPGRAPEPTWLTIPQRGLYTGIMILGAVGTGKTSACMYPYVDQLLRWRPDDPDQKMGGLVLEVKGDFCRQVRGILKRAGRESDYVEVGLNSGVCYNPLHNDLDPYAVYNTTPGFCLLVGPDWQGDAPRGITKVFRSPTNTGFVGPRIAQNDTPEDKNAVQRPLTQVLMYPLADFDGAMKSIDWKSLPHLPAKAPTGCGETQWVFPETFFDVLPAVLADGPPLPGEEARYAQVLAVLDALERNPSLKAAMITAATEVEQQVVDPLFQFRNYGLITGAPSPTSRRLAPTTSHGPRWRSRTFSSTRRRRRSTTTRTSTPQAHA
jgi:hypothetical protein